MWKKAWSIGDFEAWIFIYIHTKKYVFNVTTGSVFNMLTVVLYYK
jgi:hypothetical protein